MKAEKALDIEKTIAIAEKNLILTAYSQCHIVLYCFFANTPVT